jgi:hypothetical protein
VLQVKAYIDCETLTLWPGEVGALMDRAVAESAMRGDRGKDRATMCL